MEKKTQQNIRLGLFVISGFVILTLSLYFIGNNKSLFGNNISIYAKFRDSGGLQKGNNVRYSGMEAGIVSSIIMVNDSTITVEMSIEPEMQEFIRTNALAAIGNDGLMGNRLVSITPGTGAGELISEGSEIKSVNSINTDEMLRTLESTNLDIADFSHNLKIISENINQSRGYLYSSLLDTSLGSEIHKILANLNRVSAELSTVTNHATTILSDVRNGDGLLSALIYDTSTVSEFNSTLHNLNGVSEELNKSVINIRQVSEKVNSGNGTIPVLINDESAGTDVKILIKNLRESSDKLNRNLEALKHNWFFRKGFRKMDKQDN